MARLADGFGLVVPPVLAAACLALVVRSGGSLSPGLALPLIAVLLAVLGVTLTVLAMVAYMRFRLARLTVAIEQLARGETSVSVTVRPGGFDSRLARAINEAARALSTTRDAATIDRLTGIPNRQALLAELFGEVERSTRYQRPLSVAFVDIDHFKSVNDSYGHAVGDEVLRGVAQAIRASLRSTDAVGRYGGEEFMLVLPETRVEDGALIAEKLRLLVQRLTFDVEGNPRLSVTISIGLAGGVGQQLQVERLVRDADAAMYSAKSLGRNQTYIFAEPDEDSRIPRAPITSAGRARAIEVGRTARDAAAAALTSFVAPMPPHRGQPSALIASIAITLARHLDLPDQEVERLTIAALLHDLGKVAIPADILEKPAPLTTAEWRSVAQHPRVGQVILEQASALREAVPIILHHHERYAGDGYPHGLRGTDIPLGARIVAIADAYEAMTHDRPYKLAISHDEAIRELRRHAGSQFDPDLVARFCDLYASAAPEPDEQLLAMTAVRDVHGSGSPTPATGGRGRRRRAAGSGGA